MQFDVMGLIGGRIEAVYKRIDSVMDSVSEMIEDAESKMSQIEEASCSRDDGEMTGDEREAYDLLASVSQSLNDCLDGLQKARDCIE